MTARMTGRPSLREATGEALTQAFPAPPLPGVQSPLTSKRGLSARMRALETAHGGPERAAAATGVSSRTWRRWRAGLTGSGTPRLTSHSRDLVESAYQAHLRQAAQTVARIRANARRLAASGPVRRAVIVTAEIQWDGYYMGQGSGAKNRGPTNKRYPPDPDNIRAHRTTDLGNIDVAPVLSAWGSGRDAGIALEESASEEYSAQLYFNTYYHSAEVKIV